MHQVYKDFRKLCVLFLGLCICAGSLCLDFSNIKAQNDSKTVKIGWYQSPLFQEGDTDLKAKGGYSYEYLQRVSDYTGWKYEYVYGTFEESYERLLSGEIDLLAGVTLEGEHVKTVLYPNYAMGNHSYYICQKTQSELLDASDYSSFDNKTVGCVIGSFVVDDLSAWINDHGLKTGIRYFDTLEELNTALQNGTIDGCAISKAEIMQFKSCTPVVVIGEKPFFLTVSKERPELLQELNHALKMIETLDSFFISNLQYKFYGDMTATDTLSKGELEWLSNHSVLKIGYMEAYLPYCGTGKDGKVTGLITDVMRGIVTSLKIGDKLKIEYYPYQSYKEMIKAVADGSIDATFPVGGSVWDIEQDGFDATTPVVSASMNLVYKGTYRQDLIKTIAVNKNNNLQNYYVNEQFPNAKLVHYDTIDECLRAVVSGETSATIINGLRVDLMRKRSEFDELSLLQLSAGDDRCIGVKNGNSDLLLLLNRGLSLIGREYGVNASYYYMDELYSKTFFDFIKQNVMATFAVVFVIFGLIVTGLILYSSGIKKAERQTQLQLTENKKLTLEREDQIKKITALNASLEKNQSQIQSLSKVYFSAFFVDLATNQFEEITSLDVVREQIHTKGDAQQAFWYFCDHMVEEADREELHAFVDLSTINERMKDKETITCDYKGKMSGWSQLFIIAGERNKNGALKNLFVASRTIHDEKMREEKQNKEIREARIAAERANNAKTNFLFNMSHDIRTPMNAIMGFTGLLEKNIDNKEKREDYIKKINSSSSVLLSIINNVLEMARIEKGVMELAETAWSSTQINDTLYSVFDELMKQKGITFTREIHVEHEYVFCDSIKLREVFLNILSNAYKYTNGGGLVHMKLCEVPCDRDGFVFYQTTISDTGIGMSEDYLPHIFEEFSREKNSTDVRIEGTGLGMPIVKHLVDMMHGTITVTSKKNVGTTFVVTIPHRIAKKEDLIKNNGVQVDPTLFIGKRILLAEDNDLNSEIAIELLKEAGFVVERAEDGQICVDMLKKAPAGYYDLVLMDIQMPNMNGYEATIAIRKMEDPMKASIKIVAMTANAFEEDKREAFCVGMDGHLAKPINVGEVMSELERVLIIDKESLLN